MRRRHPAVLLIRRDATAHRGRARHCLTRTEPSDRVRPVDFRMSLAKTGPRPGRHPGAAFCDTRRGSPFLAGFWRLVCAPCHAAGAMRPPTLMFRHLATACGIAFLLAACAGPPALVNQTTAVAAAPVILPLDGLLAAAGPNVANDPGPGLAARAARLRARAGAMQGPFGDPATRARLQAALQGGQP